MHEIFILTEKCIRAGFDQFIHSFAPKFLVKTQFGIQYCISKEKRTHSDKEPGKPEEANLILEKMLNKLDYDYHKDY